MDANTTPDIQAKTGRNKRGQFLQGQSGNPSGRPPAMPIELRQRLTEASGEIIDSVIEAARNGDIQAARLVMERIAPVSRATAPTVFIPELEQATSLTEKAQAVIGAIGRGDCPPDIGATMIQALGAMAKIIELDELERRLTALEANQ